MQPELQALVHLQAIDDQIARLDEELKKIPSLIETGKDYIRQFEEEVQVAEAELGVVQKRQRDTEGEIQMSDEKLRESRGKQPLVKTNEEYRALTREIEAFQRNISELEDRVLECMESLEPLKEKVSEEKKGLEKAKDTVSMSIKKHEDNSARIEHELEKFQRDREKAYMEISPDWRERYETVRKGRGGVAVVPIIERICHGCRMGETIQRFFEIRDSKDEIFSCSNCGRIIYYQSVEAVGMAAADEIP